MDRNIDQFVPQKGMDVYGSDNEKVGEVDAVERDYFVVRKGFFFPEDHYIPVDAVSSYDDSAIYLNYTKDQVLDQQWSAPPAEGMTLAGTEADYRDADLNQVDTTTRAGQAGSYDDLDLEERTTTDHTEGSIPVHEEELVARRREVDRGDVQINKRVVAEEQSIDVPVTEEQVEVTRRAVDREVAPGEHAFEEETIEIPVHGEEVDVEKRTRVTEEIDVDKTARQHTERVSDTVRREEVDIEGDELRRDDLDSDKNR